MCAFRKLVITCTIFVSFAIAAYGQATSAQTLGSVAFTNLVYTAEAIDNILADWGGGGGSSINSNEVANIIKAEGFISTNDTSFTLGKRKPSAAIGELSLAAGSNTVASGAMSLAAGSNTVASGAMSFASGVSSTATGQAAHAEGNATIASGYGSHSEGCTTEAKGNCSHAEGRLTSAYGKYSHASGVSAIASNDISYVWSGVEPAENPGSVTNKYGSHGEGTFNVNPKGGLRGFYIGKTSLESEINALSSSINASSTIIEFTDGTYEAFSLVGPLKREQLEEICGGNWASNTQKRSISSIKVGNSIYKIDNYCFENCNTLSRVYLPETIQYLEKYAFYNCQSLFYINIPSKLISIGNHCFDKTTVFWELRLKGVISSIADYAFSSNPFLGYVEIDPSVPVTIRPFAFEKSPLTGGIKLGPNITSVEHYAFKEIGYSSSPVKKITIPRTIGNLGVGVFTNSYISQLEFTDRTMEEVRNMANYPWGIVDESIITNKLFVTANDIPTIPTKVSQLTNDVPYLALTNNNLIIGENNLISASVSGKNIIVGDGNQLSSNSRYRNVVIGDESSIYNSNFSIALGDNIIISNKETFVWNKTTSGGGIGFPSIGYSSYSDHGAGTFNINPINGIGGFYIGDQSLLEHLQNEVPEIAITNGFVTQSQIDSKQYPMFIIDLNPDGSNKWFHVELKATTNNFGTAGIEGMTFFCATTVNGDHILYPDVYPDWCKIFVLDYNADSDVRRWKAISNTYDLAISGKSTGTLVIIVDPELLQRNQGTEWLYEGNEELIWSYVRIGHSGPEMTTDNKQRWRAIMPVRWYKQLPNWAIQEVTP